MEIWKTMPAVRLWPLAPVDNAQSDGRYRGIAAVGSAKLNGSKGSGTVLHFTAMSDGSMTDTGPSCPNGSCRY